MLTLAIRNIIIACTSVYLVQTFLRLFAPLDATRWYLSELGLVPLAVTHGLRLWQPVTYLFLHDVFSFWHLLFNMLFLWMFGSDLERTWGTHRFYVYYFVSGIWAGCTTVLVKTLLDPHGTGVSVTPTIGASGAIYGVLLAAAIVFPDRQIWLIPFPVQIPMKIYVAGALRIDFFSSPRVAGHHIPHLNPLPPPPYPY